MQPDQRGKPLITDAEFEVITGPTPVVRPVARWTWGDQAKRSTWIIANGLVQVGYVVAFIAIMWALKTFVVEPIIASLGL